MDTLLAPFRWVGLIFGDAFDRFLDNHPWRWILGVGGAVAFGALLLTFELPPVRSDQRNFRGTGMYYIYNPAAKLKDTDNFRVIAPLPPVKPSGVPSEKAYQNIEVLKGLDSNEFLRLMGTFPLWIAPAVGCSYCHSGVNMADNLLYTKTVARRMIQMTQDINANWKSHVGNQGVTCNTCHRGHAVPVNTWFITPAPHDGLAETATGYDGPSHAAALTSLQQDPFSNLLLQADSIRITGRTALPNGQNRQSIQQTDQTYALMAHFGHSLGVGCTYCHDTRDFSSWDQGTPARLTAWYGIEMTRDLNNQYMVPLTDTFPRSARGPLGDVAKINCATCHQGAYKPMYGADALAGYPELIGTSADRVGGAAARSGANP